MGRGEIPADRRGSLFKADQDARMALRSEIPADRRGSLFEADQDARMALQPEIPADRRGSLFEADQDVRMALQPEIQRPDQEDKLMIGVESWVMGGGSYLKDGGSRTSDVRSRAGTERPFTSSLYDDRTSTPLPSGAVSKTPTRRSEALTRAPSRDSYAPSSYVGRRDMARLAPVPEAMSVSQDTFRRTEIGYGPDRQPFMNETINSGPIRRHYQGGSPLPRSVGGVDRYPNSRDVIDKTRDLGREYFRRRPRYDD